MVPEEALSAGYPEITIAHVLVALARLGDPEGCAQADNAAPRQEFEQLGSIRAVFEGGYGVSG